MNYSTSFSRRLWLLGLFLLLSQQLVFSYYWHAVDPSKSVSADPLCKKYESTQTVKEDINDLIEKYQFWPNLLTGLETNHPNSTIYGMKYAVEAIWNHQHPPKDECKTKRFAIAAFHPWGFGSEIHVIGEQLLFAMDMNLILLFHPLIHPQLAWQTKNPFCQNRTVTNLECYYESLSSCTIYDALGPKALDKIKQISTEEGMKSAPIPLDGKVSFLVLFFLS
jgi:hypothetical protein